ncbi:glycosyltransferase [Fodinibius sediminis]|uniref:Glycosyltransferase involved in cell wall bisynthesis n=1 Tax=Fodinibius sediminis TaxID=1214077 RepID=A0A521B328_9BACT|nr:glycosyltransferase [Fodinibius sediminis]SMO41507.1 Glycosyltransferase involved in cell wall bisynthesis [Fodinibius sediminis]
MSTDKTICLIIHSLGIGGMERVMAQLAVNFADRTGTEVHLILIGRDRKVVYEIPKTVVVHKPGFIFNNSRRTVDTLRTIYFLRSRVLKIKPDTILSFGEIWNNLVLIALYGAGFPVYISDRSQPGKDLGRLHNFLRSKLYPKAAGYIAQTKEAKKICSMNRWNNNIEVIGNPIRQIHSNGQAKRENVVLSIGRLIRTKHFDELIKMFVDIGLPDWKLVIVGGDSKKQNLSRKLKTLVRELDAEGSVFLEGEQQHIDPYFNKSKIFAFSSSSEGFPNVIGEALSAGLPVVAYDCNAGPSDMIENNKNGFLVPLFDQEAFKDCLKELMSNENVRKKFQQNAPKGIQDFIPDEIADKFYSFILSHESNH